MLKPFAHKKNWWRIASFLYLTFSLRVLIGGLVLIFSPNPGLEGVAEIILLPIKIIILLVLYIGLIKRKDLALILASIYVLLQIPISISQVINRIAIHGFPGVFYDFKLYLNFVALLINPPLLFILIQLFRKR